MHIDCAMLVAQSKKLWVLVFLLVCRKGESRKPLLGAVSNEWFNGTYPTKTLDKKPAAAGFFTSNFNKIATLC